MPDEIENSSRGAIAPLLTTAMQHHRAGQLTEAECLYQQILLQQPDQPNALYLLGLLAHQTGKLEIAVQWYRQAIAAKPDYTDAHNNLGAALQQQGKLEAAIAHYHVVLRLQPSNPHAHINLGTTLQQQGKLEAAIARYHKAIQLNPQATQAYTNLGNALKEQGDLEAAIAQYQTALHLAPDNPDVCRDLGDALQEDGQIEAAIALYDRAIAQHPNHPKLRGSRIRAKLIAGDLRDGFAEYDSWRLGMMSQSQPFAQPLWDGSNLNGKTILLYAEAGSGFGDTIQFIRYVPLVAQQGGRVIVQCQPALQRLLQSLSGSDRLLTTDDPLPDFAVHASLLSLPRIFGTTLETIPNQIPYLAIGERGKAKGDEGGKGGEARVRSLSSSPHLPIPPSPSFTLPSPSPHSPIPPSPSYQIGLVWGGNPEHCNDRDRSCPLAELLPIFQIPNTTFYSLQKGPHRDELQTIAPDLVQDLGDRLHDFADTAAFLQQLDLVISVDTAVAHLAGALGVPVWILLSFAPDWRWLMERQDSPWYPTARLFRQSRRNDWAGVCQQVATALHALELCMD